ncbi:MAG TPA: hypothetical protein PKA82_09960 [Pyrinomonadaceae bacterium]|nr:hypothetical protein [Pyrinomonadaceae bacterium]
MRFWAILLFALLVPTFAAAQEKPLTRAEYVQLLYAAEKAPAKRAELAETLRRRGIDFVLDDGMRGLTRTKTANNEDVKRALEESDRKRKDPVGTALPSAAEQLDILDKAKSNTWSALDEMPDFVVKQLIARSEAYAGTGNWQTYSNLVIAVSYSNEKGEQYRVLVKDGAPVQDATTQNSYNGLSGATSGGEFVEDLKKIFDKDSKTKFEAFTTDVVRGRRAVVYNYEIDIQNNKNGGVGLKDDKARPNGYSPAGEKGQIWIDRDAHRILRIEYKLTNIEPNFPVKAVTKVIDYDMIEITGEKYLLPILSDFRGTVAGSGKMFEQRNVIRFRNYQKFGTDVVILDDDVVAPETKPTEKR